MVKPVPDFLLDKSRAIAFCKQIPALKPIYDGSAGDDVLAALLDQYAGINPAGATVYRVWIAALYYFLLAPGRWRIKHHDRTALNTVAAEVERSLKDLQAQDDANYGLIVGDVVEEGYSTSISIVRTGFIDADTDGRYIFDPYIF